MDLLTVRKAEIVTEGPYVDSLFEDNWVFQQDISSIHVVVFCETNKAVFTHTKYVYCNEMDGFFDISSLKILWGILANKVYCKVNTYDILSCLCEAVPNKRKK